MGKALAGFIWLSTGTSGRLMSIRKLMFGLHKMRGMCWVAEHLLSSEQGIRFVELLMFQCMLGSGKERTPIPLSISLRPFPRSI